MSTLVTIQSTDLITNSRANINDNFSALNTDKMETSVLDSDTTLAADSDAKVPTQKAVKAYVDAGGNINASTTAKGIVEEADATETLAGTAVGATGARLFVNPSNLAGYMTNGGFLSKEASGVTSFSSSTTNTINCGFQARAVRITAFGKAGATTSSPAESKGGYSATVNACSYQSSDGGGVYTAGTSTSYAWYVKRTDDSRYHRGIVNNITATTFDLVNTKLSTVDDVQIYWEAYA